MDLISGWTVVDKIDGWTGQWIKRMLDDEYMHKLTDPMEWMDEQRWRD